MSKIDIVRAWKDPVYRASLSAEQRAALPQNPAGSVEISDEDLGKVSAGAIRGGAVGSVGGSAVYREIKDSDFCTLACPTKVLCSLNDCSAIACATAYPNCPITKAR
jgi:mersacidin/lichenicidin family type 2 lantibiotic